MTAAMTGIIIALCGPLLLAAAGKRFVPPGSPPLLHLLATGVYVAMVAAVLFIILRWEHRPLSSIGLRPIRWQTAAWGLALAGFFMYAFAPAAYWALARFNLGGFEPGLAKCSALPIWILAVNVIFGGAAEELLYRGYAIERIAMLTGSYWVAGAVSTLFFGLGHVPGWGWGPSLTTVASGAVAAAFYIWQRDLAALVIAHVITDFAGIVIMPYLARTKGF